MSSQPEVHFPLILADSALKPENQKKVAVEATCLMPKILDSSVLQTVNFVSL